MLRLVLIMVVPLYFKCQAFVSRKVEDFGNGGAFPEIYIAQYPLNTGKDSSAKSGSKILPLTVDACGNVAYDYAIMLMPERLFIPSILIWYRRS